MFEQALKKKQTTTRLMYLCGPMVGYPKFTCEPNDSHKLPLICNQRDSRQFHRVMDQLDADTIAASWSMREWNEKNSSTQFRDLDDERGRLAMRNHEARRADHPGESPSRGIAGVPLTGAVIPPRLNSQSPQPLRPRRPPAPREKQASGCYGSLSRFLPSGPA
jgi:hypothetical protein